MTMVLERGGPAFARIAYLGILVPGLLIAGVGVGYLIPGFVPSQLDFEQRPSIQIEVLTSGFHSALIPGTEPIMLEEKVVDRHSRVGTLTGTFSGPVTSIEQVLIDSEGRFSALIFDSCDPCSVDGKTGTLIFRIIGRGPIAAGKAGADWGIVAGTGELSNLCGSGTFEATFNADATVSRAYSGGLKFVDSFDEEICRGHLQSVDQALPGLLSER